VTDSEQNFLQNTIV